MYLTQGCFVPSLVEIGTVVLEKKIFKFHQCTFCFFVFISPWKKGWVLPMNQFQIWIPFTKECFVHSLVEIGPVTGFGKEDLFVNIILLFRYYLPWKMAGPFICKNLNSFYPRMLCIKFSWNWPSGSGEEDKRPSGLNGHLSIRDFSLTSCQRGSYLYINSPIIE